MTIYHGHSRRKCRLCPSFFEDDYLRPPFGDKEHLLFCQWFCVELYKYALETMTSQIMKSISISRLRGIYHKFIQESYWKAQLKALASLVVYNLLEQLSTDCVRSIYHSNYGSFSTHGTFCHSVACETINCARTHQFSLRINKTSILR